MENNQENSRNQLAKEADENIKNSNIRYLIAGMSIIIVLAILGYLVISKLSSNEITEDEKKTEYGTKGKNFVIDTLDRREAETTTQNEEPKEEQKPSLLGVENNKTTKPAKAQIVKSGIVVGEAANTYQGGNLEFKRKSTFLNLGQEIDESGNITPKMTGKDGDNGDIFSPTAAYFSTFDRNLLLAKGTYIGCSLKTRLVSDIKGGIACIISNDVYSANGRTLLIEKGSIVTGTYNGASVEEGMERIYVIWQEIRTPNNIIIPVFSGASDRLGGAGIEGWVDNHYFKRFGSAILVSVIDDFISAFANNISQRKSENNGNSTNVFTPDSTTQQVNDLATKTLDKMINIKPTLYKNHGDIVGIYVNRDIDFRNVYELKRKNNE